MSASNDDPRTPIAPAVLSESIADLITPGVMVEVDAEEAASLGAFEETALTEADAWEANGDLDPEDGEAVDGD